jgi:hypothetical protein
MRHFPPLPDIPIAFSSQDPGEETFHEKSLGCLTGTTLPKHGKNAHDQPHNSPAYRQERFMDFSLFVFRLQHGIMILNQRGAK